MLHLPDNPVEAMNWKTREETLFIVVDSSKDPDWKKTAELTAYDLAKRDRQQGFLSGKHNYVILRDGSVHCNRRMDAPGAAVRGLNQITVALCLVGGADHAGNPESNYTLDQWEALEGTVRLLQAYYPVAHVVGIGDLPKRNSGSPGFEVYEWLGHIGIENTPMESRFRQQKENWDARRKN